VAVTSRSSPDFRVTTLADRLHSAAIHLLRRVRREDDVSGLSAARLSALSVIVFGGPIRISALARAEHVRTPTMTPIVAALEAEGLITREVDSSDARASLLRATARGSRLMSEARGRRVSLLSSDLQQLPANDRATVLRAVDILERLVGPRSTPSPTGQESLLNQASRRSERAQRSEPPERRGAEGPPQATAPGVRGTKSGGE
jgi:DNA-binding MarR family transcriptional regulator